MGFIFRRQAVREEWREQDGCVNAEGKVRAMITSQGKQSGLWRGNLPRGIGRENTPLSGGSWNLASEN